MRVENRGKGQLISNAGGEKVVLEPESETTVPDEVWKVLKVRKFFATRLASRALVERGAPEALPEALPEAAKGKGKKGKGW